MTTLRARLVERIRRAGSITYADYVDAALYDPAEGFFATGGGAGRLGRDFLTSPEVGPLFGALVARALDRWWDELGRPDPWLVIEAGAGTGRLAREVVRAAPACGPALRYCLVERSPAARTAEAELLPLEPPAEVLGGPAPDAERDDAAPAAGGGPRLTALDAFPAGRHEAVVIANELLDDLPFRVVVRTLDGWDEVRVGVVGNDLVEETIEAPDDLVAELERFLDGGDVPAGTRLPVPTGAVAWIDDVAADLERGRVLLVDYAAPVADLASRDGGWLRAYSAHRRGRDPFADPGRHDVTIDLPLEALREAATAAGLTIDVDTTQAEWLRDLGLDDLVAAGERTWRERASIGDLEALAGRSRASEAAALTDPAGLGAYRVLVLRPR